MKILLLDIETAPNLAHVWGIWQQNVGLNQLLEAGYTLCWSAKWLGEKEVMFSSVHETSPRKMVKRIHGLLDQADAVIHYNGTSFDIPTLQREMVQLDMKPPSPFKQIDLLLTVKKQFRFPSNKLAYVVKALGIGEKEEHEGHTLWVKCMNGDAAAWKKMESYNRQDTLLLEKLYERLKPWIKGHPNVGVHLEAGIPVCVTCGSGNVIRQGYTRTQVNKFARYQCKDCGSWTREAISEFATEDRRNLLRPIA